MTDAVVSVRLPVRALKRLALSAALIASACQLAASAASADTPFGGNPSGAITPGATCESGGPPYFRGAPTCTWFWSRIGVGSGFVPLPVTGGTGVITSVTVKPPKPKKK